MSYFGHKFTVLFILQLKLKECWLHRDFSFEDFRELRDSEIFVDKTLLIKEIFKHHLLLITAPRQFGKSLNVEMISLFLRNDQDQKETEEIFNGTNIWLEDIVIRNHMNNYPVLFCNFDSGFEVSCEKTLLSYYRQVLYGIFIEHDYLRDSPVLNADQREMFNSYIDDNDSLERWKIVNGLRFISQLLHLHHAKKVIVLIDEYDAIIVNSIFNDGNSTLDYGDGYFNVTRNIYILQNELFRNTFQNNDHVERGLITGTLPLDLHTNYSKGKLKIKYIGFMQNTNFVKFYGFTQREVQNLMKRFKLTKAEQDEVNKWYDGYCSPKGKVRVYNPWVVTKFLEDKLAYDYWVQTFPLKDILLPLLNNTKIQETMVKLVQSSEEIGIKIKGGFTIDDVHNLKKIIDKRWDGKTDTDIFFHFLIHAGYLTFGKVQKRFPKTEMLIKVPNREIHQELEKTIQEYFSLKL